MAEFQENPITGTSYVRTRGIYIDYPLGGTPSVLLNKERVMLFEGTPTFIPEGEILKVLTNMSESFPLRNPVDNSLIEGQQGSYQDLFVLMFSAVYQMMLDET